MRYSKWGVFLSAFAATVFTVTLCLGPVATTVYASPPTIPDPSGPVMGAANQVTALASGVPPAPASYMVFESGQVRPIAVVGNRLLALNTPDNHVEIFEINPSNGHLLATGRYSVPVGMEPVALAVRNNEAWVVNHLSDSISIIDLAAAKPHVIRTLLVGDEPRDIVFAGPDRDHAFITTARRGQHRVDPSIAGQPNTGDPAFLNAGIGRADVWVFDSEDLDQGATTPTLGGVPVKIIELFGDTPRALAVSRDGKRVYAAIFHSGNRTTIIHEEGVMNGFEGAAPVSLPDFTGTLPDGFIDLPGGLPGPDENAGMPTADAPETGLIVQYKEALGQWVDEQNRDWSDAVRFELPDYDVFEIDTSSAAISDPEVVTRHSGVGTILFNMVVGDDGTLYVSNTEANNLVRFEGEGLSAGKTPPSVQGHTHETHITVIDSGNVKPRHINRHIDYSCTPVTTVCAAAPPSTSLDWHNGVREHSLATPLQMLIDGGNLYMAAFGSSKVGVFSTTALKDDAKWTTPYPAGFDPKTASSKYLGVSGGGPSGLALARFSSDPNTGFLYVLTRFDNAVSVIDLSSGTEVQHVEMHNPEPDFVVEGRPFLYDAVVSSSNGENSCASCHVFGQFDGLAWDLGDPDAGAPDSNIPRAGNNGRPDGIFHPIKGPMTTQTLRGMVNHGAMHWRGDRAIGEFGSDPFDTTISFMNFLPAFEGLLGLEEDFSEDNMMKFAQFALALSMPPNPVRALDNSLTSEEDLGAMLFKGSDREGQFRPTDGETCDGCHTLSAVDGFFGTSGLTSLEGVPQIFKVPQLRNMYQKVGMFGLFQMPGMFQPVPLDGANNPLSPIVTNDFMGPQIRGFGYLHDGSVDNLLRFFHGNVFEFHVATSGIILGMEFDERLAMTKYMLAFDNDIAPMVGQQVTYDTTNGATVLPRLAQFGQASDTPFASKILGGLISSECEIVVKAIMDGEYRGAWLDPSAPDGSKRFLGDDGIYYSDAAVLSVVAAGQELTFTCVPPGSGKRMGIDRDGDDCFDLLDPDPADANLACP